MFKGFYIIWPGDLVFNWVKVILAILVEDHPRIIPVKFGWDWPGVVKEEMLFKEIVKDETFNDVDDDGRRTTTDDGHLGVPIVPTEHSAQGN